MNKVAPRPSNNRNGTTEAAMEINIKELLENPIIDDWTRGFCESLLEQLSKGRTLSEKQKEIVSQDIVVNMDGGVGGSWKVNSEPDNIHELMYDMATKHGKTTTQLDPVGGSENFQGGSENIQA